MCAEPSTQNPTANTASSGPRHGMSRRAKPASPNAATRQVAMTNVGSATSRWPAARSVSTNGVQLVVPRRISTGLSHAVVTPADSMKSVNGGE